MIKMIVKRDGTLEEFKPSKLNQWAQWASQAVSEHVDWVSIVQTTVKTLPSQIDSQSLQEKLIQSCLDYGTDAHNLMAGHLYGPLLQKKVFGGKLPTIQELHSSLVARGVMIDLGYTDSLYEQCEALIDHSRDYQCTYQELKQVNDKYCLSNRVTEEKYETRQFAQMRMAMAVASEYPTDQQFDIIKAIYNSLSNGLLNAPTPDYVNLGTPLRAFASCCTYTTNDSAASLNAGDHIAYMMTCDSAGIGNNIVTRSVGDPVRNGLIKHQGRLPYYKHLGTAVKANLQNGRGGACTTFYSAYDPQALEISGLGNPRATESKRNRDLDYAFISNKFFARKVALNEDVFMFNVHRTPDLWDAMFSSDPTLFSTLYAKYDNDVLFPKTYINARDLLVKVITESFETGRHYLMWSDEMNRHTPFKEPIYSSNLCLEIALPTEGYKSVVDLYDPEGAGEIGLCSLFAINVGQDLTLDQYREVMYYGLLMKDSTIHNTDYTFPQLKTTATARLSVGVGMVGVAQLMAKKGLRYTSQAGKDFLHALAERHAYVAIEQSLRLAKEKGLAPWISKTKWPEGWLPIDTYTKSVDQIVKPVYNFDWEALRKEIIEFGGIRNSVLIAYMPAEASSKATGTTNSIYPIRGLTLLKTDDSSVVDWTAPQSDSLGDAYEIAWDIPTKDQIELYAIFQKFTDQSISADLWYPINKGDKISSAQIVEEYIYMTKLGLKTRYYTNTRTTEGGIFTDSIQEDNCAGGSCKL